MERSYTPGEQIADAVVHVVGVFLGIVATTILAVAALPSGNRLLLASLGLYAAGLLAMLGSPDYFDESIDGAVNAALANRQPGSALKPGISESASLIRECAPSPPATCMSALYGWP